MANDLTTTTQVDSAVSVYYDRLLLKRALPNLVFNILAQKRPIPSKSSKTIKFRRYTSLAAATTPVTEGVTPPADLLAKTDLTAVLQQYIGVVKITDIIDLTVEDDVLTEAVELQGEQMGLTFDTIIRDVVVASLTSVNATNGGNGGTPTEFAKKDIDAAVKTLKGANAKYVAPMIKAGPGVGTVPIPRSFWGIMHTDLTDALEAVSNYKGTHEYPSQNDVQDSEYGSTGKVRWLESTNAHKDTSTSPDSYKCPIIGRDAYGVTELSAGIVESIIKGFGSGDDPANQRATSAWKALFTARILNDTWIYLLKVSNLAASG